MAKESKIIEGPAGYNGSGGPGNAGSLPTKDYASSKLANSGSKGCEVEGPGEQNWGQGKK